MSGMHRGKLWRRAAAAPLLCALLLTGCAPSVLVPERAVPAGDPLAGAVIDPKDGYRAVLRTASSPETVERAAAALEGLGVLTAEERGKLTPDSFMSRAEFISLIVRALGGESPEALPEETWYAGWVKAGYAMGLFAHSTEDMSFTPSDGFRMGERGYEEMDRPMGRGDAAAVLAHAYLARTGRSLDLGSGAGRREAEAELAAAQGLLPKLEDGQFHADSCLSWGEAVVCAWRLTQLPKGEGLYSPEPAADIAERLREGRVIHGGGQVAAANGKRYTYTNSAQALLNAYRAGHRVIEIDMSQTSDGHLACIHGWSGKYADAVTDGVPLSLEEWRRAKIYGEFTPLSLESVADFMRQHPDLYIVTDVKDDNTAAAAIIAETCPDLRERFVIQIYRDEEYAPVAALGFPHIIYTLYNLSNAKKLDTAHWREFAGEHALVGYTIPQKWFEREGYAEELLKAGVPLMVHTVDKQEEMDACYAAGVTAVYTNITG